MGPESFEQWSRRTVAAASTAHWRRIDELHAAVALCANRGPLRDRDRSLTVTPFGRALALRDRARPDEGRSNRVISFEADALAHLAALIPFYEDAGIACQVDVLPDRWPAVGSALRDAGFELQGWSCTSAGAPHEAALGVSDRVRVEPVGPAELDQALSIAAVVLQQSPPSPAVVEQRRADLVAQRDAYELYLARVDGEPAAIAAVFFHDRGAYLAGAMTLPAMRRRGCQLALLERRVQAAAARGCDLVVTATLGDNESQRNVERAGLRPVGWPGWWVRPLPGATRDASPRL